VNDVSGPKQTTMMFLLGGIVLASGVPLYMALTVPRLNVGTLLSPVILFGQMIPYVLCAAIWLPWRGALAAWAGRLVSGILLAVSAALYLPALLNPQWLTGDMLGLAFILVVLWMSGGVVVVSAVAAIVWWIRSRRRSSGRPAAA
jgi:hypothetical protein